MAGFMRFFAGRNDKKEQITVAKIEELFEYVRLKNMTAYGLTWKAGWKDKPYQVGNPPKTIPAHIWWNNDPKYAYIAIVENKPEYHYGDKGEFPIWNCPITTNEDHIKLINGLFSEMYEKFNLPDSLKEIQQESNKEKSAEAAPEQDKMNYDYSVLPKMAAILTVSNKQACSDMSLLSEGVSKFVTAHREWCEEMEFDDFGLGADSKTRREETLLIFAYWLAGYAAVRDPSKNPIPFGAYIDWKEETGDILWALGEADKNLGYGLDLQQIKFEGSEFTDVALKKTAEFLSAKGLSLVALDTQSDSYHLFVLRSEDNEQLTQSAAKAGFVFHSDFS